jgi:hypothetical protein
VPEKDQALAFLVIDLPIIYVFMPLFVRWGDNAIFGSPLWDSSCDFGMQANSPRVGRHIRLINLLSKNPARFGHTIGCVAW